MLAHKHVKPILIVVVVLGGLTTFSYATRPGRPTTQPHKLIPITSITHGHGLAVDPNNVNKVYIATHHGLLLLENEKSLYQVGSSNDDYMGFTASPTNSDVFYSSGHPVSGGNIGFQKSSNGGFSWTHISNGNDGPVDFHAMTISAADPVVFYGWFRGDVQRSADEGKTWTSYRTSSPYVELAADTKDKNTVYASGPRGLDKSVDGGKTFTHLLDGFTAAITVDPSNNQRLICYNETLKLAESLDGGRTWQSIKSDFGDQTPLFIAFYRGDPKLAYLLTEKNGLYKTTDGGTTWNEVSNFGVSTNAGEVH